LDTTLSVIIVAHDSGPDLDRSLPALAPELGPGDEVIVLDNGSDGSAGPAIEAPLPAARLVPMGGNPGFARAVNHGAELARGDLLLVLNPDAAPRPGFGRAIRAPASSRPGWDAWMGLVGCRIEGELRVNTWGNPVHYTGIAWAGGHGRPLAEAGEAREIPVASGACLAVRREAWHRVGGLADEFFLYHEDIDFSLRLRAAGGRIGLEPAALVDHEYEFGANRLKWFWLERNRLAMVIRNYPGPLLALVAPVLLATELALIPVAARGGWLGHKLRSWGDLARWLPRLLRERRELARRRVVPAARFARLLTPDLDSPLLPEAVRRGPVRWLLRGWWALVLALLGPDRAGRGGRFRRGLR